jgi:hypothetical protein
MRARANRSQLGRGDCASFHPTREESSRGASALGWNMRSKTARHFHWLDSSSIREYGESNRSLDGEGCLSAGQFEMLDILSIEPDRSNPRIRHLLDNYEGDVGYHQIALALDVTSQSDPTGNITTADKLRNSILANGGILQPIIVNEVAPGKFVCVEGNTRLYIYRSFLEEKVQGRWDRIPALVHKGMQEDEIDRIRLQAHLVGPRPWDAYAKAKYLWELQFKELMPLDRIVALCGGKKSEIVQSIRAYADMEAYFRPLFEEGEDYDIERYSGFVELQNQKVKDSILHAGFTLEDFAGWIKDGKFSSLQQIRLLPAVLPNKKAREVFVKKGMKSAIEFVERPSKDVLIRDATLAQLCRALTAKLGSVQYSEIVSLRSNVEEAQHVLDASDALQRLVIDELNKT